MFKHTHEALEFAYREIENEVTGMGNTASIIRWMETKGAAGGSTNDKATSTDRHGNAVLIIQRVERLLESHPLLLSAVRCQFGRGGQYYHAALMALEQHYRHSKNKGHRGGFGQLIHNIYTSTPSIQDLLDSGIASDIFDSERTFYRRKKQIRNEINGWLADAIAILEVDFQQNDIIFKQVA